MELRKREIRESKRSKRESEERKICKKPARAGHLFVPMQEAKEGDDHVFDLEQQVPNYRSSEVTLG